MENSIIGAWKLIQFEFKDEDGGISYPFGKEMRGSFIYTDSKRFSVQLVNANRPHFLISDQMRGTPEEIATAYKGVISYFGSYQVDAENKIITHFVEGSIFPNMEGTQQIRYFELKENMLILTTPKFNLDAKRGFAIISWYQV